MTITITAHEVHHDQDEKKIDLLLDNRKFSKSLTRYIPMQAE
ncbi:MAG TPA: hypothetical protein VI037_05490 [Nitrososphaera sp.]|jgi:hypothetical protein